MRNLQLKIYARGLEPLWQKSFFPPQFRLFFCQNSDFFCQNSDFSQISSQCSFFLMAQIQFCTKHFKWNHILYDVAPNLTRKKKTDRVLIFHPSETQMWIPLFHNRRLSWTQVDYMVLIGHVSFLSNAIPSIHAPHKCSCEIQSHLSEVKWESLPSLPSSLAKTLIACPAFCSRAGLIPHRLAGGEETTLICTTQTSTTALLSLVSDI